GSPLKRAPAEHRQAPPPRHMPSRTRGNDPSTNAAQPCGPRALDLDHQRAPYWPSGHAVAVEERRIPPNPPCRKVRGVAPPRTERQWATAEQVNTIAGRATPADRVLIITAAYTPSCGG